MISAGILGLVSLGTMQIVENTHKSKQFIAHEYEISELVRQISIGLQTKNGAGCTATFVGATPVNPVTGTDVDIIYSGVVINSNNLKIAKRYIPTDPIADRKIYGFGAGKIKIMKMTLKDLTNGEGQINPAQANLEITFERVSKDVTSTIRNIPVSVLVTATNVVTRCSVANEAFDPLLCESLNGNYVDPNCGNINVSDQIQTVGTSTAMTLSGHLRVFGDAIINQGDVISQSGDITAAGDLTVTNDLAVGQNMTATALAPGGIVTGNTVTASTDMTIDVPAASAPHPEYITVATKSWLRQELLTGFADEKDAIILAILNGSGVSDYITLRDKILAATSQDITDAITANPLTCGTGTYLPGSVHYDTATNTFSKDPCTLDKCDKSGEIGSCSSVYGSTGLCANGKCLTAWSQLGHYQNCVAQSSNICPSTRPLLVGIHAYAGKTYVCCQFNDGT